MVPARVSFTGLTIEPSRLLRGRKRLGPIPEDWTRVRFETDENGTISKIDDWLARNVIDDWTSYMVRESYQRRIVVVAFESDTDAVMFRLLGGETAWAETDEAGPAF